jgi:hypothetical protein
MDTLNIANFFTIGLGMLFFKIPLLILIFLYALFTFIVINRIKALNRAILITSANAAKMLQLLAILHFILVISLFIITLVIV